MTTNTFLTNDEITFETLVILKNELAFGNRCLRKFDGSFGVDGAKIGDTIRVRVPPRYTTTTGSAPAAQNVTETNKVLALQTQRNIFLSYTTKDLALAMDNFAENIIKPQMEQLASDIDSDGTLAVVSGYQAANVNNYGGQYGGQLPGFQGLATPGTISGTLGPKAWTGVDLGSGSSTPNTAMQPFFDAKVRLDNQAAPIGERYAVLSPAAHAATAVNLATLFNPQMAISDQYEKGIIGMLAGAKFYVSQSTQLFTSGAWTNNANCNVAINPVANGTGNTQITVGFGGTTGNVVANGDQFVIVGVHEVNPLTRQSTGKQQIFTVTTGGTTNATGQVVLSIYPPLQNSGAYQTVDSNVAISVNVTFQGTSATATAVNFMYNKNAIALGVAPLADVSNYGAQCYVASDEDDGLSLRFIKQYQASTDQVSDRVDILYGWSVVRPELGCRIQA